MDHHARMSASRRVNASGGSVRVRSCTFYTNFTAWSWHEATSMQAGIHAGTYGFPSSSLIHQIYTFHPNFVVDSGCKLEVASNSSTGAVLDTPKLDSNLQIVVVLIGRAQDVFQKPIYT